MAARTSQRIFLAVSLLQEAGLPVAGLDQTAAGYAVRWRTAPSSQQERQASDVLAALRVDFPDGRITDAQWMAYEARLTRRAWQDDLDGSADQRPLLVGLHLLFDVLKAQIPGLRLTWPEFLAQYKTALAAEPVPARAAARARSNP